MGTVGRQQGRSGARVLMIAAEGRLVKAKEMQRDKVFTVGACWWELVDDQFEEREGSLQEQLGDKVALVNWEVEDK
eukprot:2666426-Pyramimonas_sp.AAC.1